MDKKLGDIVIAWSFATALISAYVSFTQSAILNLAGTQWMLIAIVLGIYGIYLKGRTV